jgi:hypothetical protein
MALKYLQKEKEKEKRGTRFPIQTPTHGPYHIIIYERCPVEKPTNLL